MNCEEERVHKLLSHVRTSSESKDRNHRCKTCVQRDKCSARHEKIAIESSEMEDLFSPLTFKETQKPLLQASTLPRQCYMSESWYERELSRAFSKGWTLLGRIDEIPEAGDYISFDSPYTGPVAICRGNDGQIHAFANVCCHRGAKVLQQSSGSGSKIGLVCPYRTYSFFFHTIFVKSKTIKTFS